MKKRSHTATVLAALATGLLALSLFFFWQSTRPVRLPDPAISLPPAAETPVLTPAPVVPDAPEDSEEAPVEAGPQWLAEPEDDLPTDKLFRTVERQKYDDGGLRLIIPKLEVDVPVLAGTTKDALRRGVGLYDYAQLPSENRSNTSIAGHRNQIYWGQLKLDQAFSYLDLLEEGDCIYLRDSENIYQYVFEFQQVVTPDDWGPIYKTDHSCVTLTTCTPIGVSDHRLVVRGGLVAITPVSKEYQYLSTIAEEANQS